MKGTQHFSCNAKVQAGLAAWYESPASHDAVTALGILACLCLALREVPPSRQKVLFGDLPGAVLVRQC